MLSNAIINPLYLFLLYHSNGVYGMESTPFSYLKLIHYISIQYLSFAVPP